VSWLGKISLVLAACAASGLAAAAITIGAADSDPTHSACVDPSDKNKMHLLEPGKDCASLGIAGGFEVEWEQRGGLSAEEAAPILKSLAHQDALVERVARRGRRLNRALAPVIGRRSPFFATLVRLLHRQIAIQRRLVEDLE
jgi:hypothetical protein